MEKEKISGSSPVYYVCKYTPVELFAGFGEEFRVLEEPADDFERSDRAAHANLCGFGKSVIQAVLEGRVEKLVLVNCCDVMRRAYDIIAASGKCSWLYMLDLPHEDGVCEKLRFAESLERLRQSYEHYSGKPFDEFAFRESFRRKNPDGEPYIGILGARVNGELEALIQNSIGMPVKNLTCVRGRDIGHISSPGSVQDDKNFHAGSVNEKADASEKPADEGNCFSETSGFVPYADALLSQMPCFRMNNTVNRHRLGLDPYLKGVVYHTIKFCDYYAFEYAQIGGEISVPLLKIETDFTRQSAGQLKTRIEAFAETLGIFPEQGAAQEKKSQNHSDQDFIVSWKETDETEKKIFFGNCGKKEMRTEDWYAAGIDSGSTSTDVVIIDQEGDIVSSMVIPTGGGASASAEKCLALALDQADIPRERIHTIVTTGYGREYLEEGDASVTEITCHAKGAHYLNPAVRTIIDIGGQDIKAIRIDENGKVRNFLMNDKCAAGTGRFLELMARTLGITLEEMSVIGLEWKENVLISSMCTVFAESEVVSLVAQNKAKPDIVHGLNVSVASKVGALASRLGEEGEYMLTGGVANNPGVVKELENKLGEKLYICKEAQICGALGAALKALENCREQG